MDAIAVGAEVRHTEQAAVAVGREIVEARMRVDTRHGDLNTRRVTTQRILFWSLAVGSLPQSACNKTGANM